MQTQLVYPKEKTLFAILAVLGGLVWLLVILGTVGIALLYVLLFFILYLFAQSGFISYIKGTAVRITPEQFGALHERIRQCAAQVGMQPVPEAYLLRSDGLFNAFATKFLGRNYIALYAELVDALLDRPEALNFYIGHELGHLHRKHLNYAPLLAPVAWLPLLGAAYSRAREYTCDRYGLSCCASPDAAAHAVAVLAAGGKHAKVLDHAAYVAQRQSSSGFWMSFHELVGDYPWLVKRLHAVRELGKGKEPAQPSRHPLAWLLAFFVPRSGVPGGGGAGMLIIVAVIAMLAAIAIPQYSKYQQRTAQAAAMSQFESTAEAPEAPALDTASKTAAAANLTSAELDDALITSSLIERALENHIAARQDWASKEEAMAVSLETLGIDENELAQGRMEAGGGVRLVGYENGEILIHFGAVPSPLVRKASVTGENGRYRIDGWTCQSEHIPSQLLARHCA